MTFQRPPEHGPQFEAMMAQIDFKLTNNGDDIPSRPMLAVREVSMTYNLSIPLGGDTMRMPPELRENAALSEAIHQWYKDNYGDRLKEDPCPGRMVILLDGDLYVLRVPRIFGSVNFVLTRQWLPNLGIGRGPATCNITQLVDGMTAAKAGRLSDAALDTIGRAFEIAVPATFTLESTGHNLMFIARGDVEAAVNGLMARGGRYGESKWASLQAAEKVLKAAIDREGAKYHGLAALCKTLADTGLSFNADAQVAAIQCKPGIRYGEEPCACDEALAAHRASLELVNILRDQARSSNWVLADSKDRVEPGLFSGPQARLTAFGQLQRQDWKSRRSALGNEKLVAERPAWVDTGRPHFGTKRSMRLGSSNVRPSWNPTFASVSTSWPAAIISP